MEKWINTATVPIDNNLNSIGFRVSVYVGSQSVPKENSIRKKDPYTVPPACRISSKSKEHSQQVKSEQKQETQTIKELCYTQLFEIKWMKHDYHHSFRSFAIQQKVRSNRLVCKNVKTALLTLMSRWLRTYVTGFWLLLLLLWSQSICIQWGRAQMGRVWHDSVV